MICITGYGFIVNKPRVGQLGQIFSVHPVGSKNEQHVFDGLDELYHHAQFGEDRTTRSSCRCENVALVVFRLDALA